MEASAEWAGPLVLLPDVIEVQAIGDSQAGPSLDVTLEQADEEDAEAEWAVNFAGAVAIVALSDSDLPTLGVEGALRSTGASPRFPHACGRQPLQCYYCLLYTSPSPRDS